MTRVAAGAALSQHASRDPRTIALVVAASCSALFLLLTADLAWWGLTQPVDEAAARWVGDLAQTTHDRWDLASDVLSYGIAIPAALAGLGVLAWRRRWRACIMVLAAFALLLLNDHMLKELFGRARPLPGRDSFAYPSGHTFTATLIPVAVLLSRPAWPEAWRRHVPVPAVLAAWAVLAVLAGATRVFAGAHWVTDVVATWALAAALASLLFVAAAPRPD